MAAGQTVTIRLLGDSRQLQAALDEAGIKADVVSKEMGDKMDGASSRVGGIFQKLGSTLGNWGIPFSGAVTKVGDKFDEASTKGQKFGQAMSTLGGTALLGGAVAFAAIGAESIEMADKFDVAQAQLKNAVKNSGESFKQLEPSIQATYGHLANLGFNSTQAASSLTSLVIATGNTGRAEQVLSVAADLARAKHIGLDSATQILVKTMAGSTRGLTQLGLNLDIGSAKATAMRTASDALQSAQVKLKDVQDQVASGALTGAKADAALTAAKITVAGAAEKLSRDQKAQGDILDAIKKKTEGAANAYGQTLAGQVEIARAKLHNLGTEFGEKLIPIITKAIDIVSKIVGFFERNKAAAIALAVVIGGILTGAIIAWTASLFAAGGALAFVTAPILAIIAAVALLAVGVYEVIKHWGAISKFFEKLWDDVKHYFLVAVDFLKNLFLDFTPEGLIISHWSQIVGFFSSMWSAVTGLFSHAINTIVGFFSALPGRIVGALGSIVTTIWGGFATAASWINTNVIKPVVAFFTALPGQIVATLGSIVTTIWQNLVTAAQWVYNNVITPVVNYFTQLPGRIVAGLGNIVSTIWSGLTSAAQWVSDNVITPVVNLFTKMPGTIASDLVNFISDIFSGIGDIGSWVDQHIVQPIVNAIKSIPSKVAGLGGSILGSIAGGLGGLGGSVLGAVGLAVGGIVNQPTLAVVGEAGPEAVIPLDDTQRALQILGLPQGNNVQSGLGGVQPLTVPAAAQAAAAGGTSQPLYLNIDGQTFARIILPALQSQGSLYQRTVPLPVYGVSNVT